MKWSLIDLREISMRWLDKPYYTLHAKLSEDFGEKVYKVALNGGMTCPNRDGTLDNRGCIFCSTGGSGDFAANSTFSITEQINQQKDIIQAKRPVRKFIAYFQAYTNTYSNITHLRTIFTEAITHSDVLILSIGTRPDCLSEEIISLLSELNQQKPIWVELGLQTIHPKTATYIRRGYDLECFEKAVMSLHHEGIEVITHIILGLPNETTKDVLATISYLNKLPIQGIKLQLLHVLTDTDLAIDYRNGLFEVLSQEDYLDLVITALEHLSPQIVLHRVTGDGPKDLLLAPTWSSAKRTVLNELHRQMRLRNTWQGRLYHEET